MGRVEANVTVEAPAARLWEVLVDVESWPRWLSTMTSVQRLDDGPLKVGSSARVVQPKMRPMVWTVTELAPERSFTWVADAPGVKVTGEHTITRLDDDRAELELAATTAGPLAFLVDLFAGRRTRDYVAREAAGTKAAAETAGH